MPGHNALYVGRHRHMATFGSYVSPYLLEILNSSVGFSSQVATGSLTALTGQTVSCSRAASAYCLGNDGLLHLLSANQIRVEPAGLLVEGQSTNFVKSSCAVGDANWNALFGSVTVTLNSTDVTDPTGANEASKLAIGAGGSIYQPDGATGSESIYLRTLSGTATVYLSDNQGGNPFTACAVTSSWQRFTVPSGNGNFCIGGTNSIPGGIGGQAACTVYAWGAQAENIPFTTSLIRTTAAAATRDMDIVTVANPLSSLSQPVPFWRLGSTAIPMATWSAMGGANSGTGLANLVNFGNNNVANAVRVFSDGVNFNFDTYDATDVVLTRLASVGPSGANTFQWEVTDTFSGGTDMHFSVPGDNTLSGTGTGIISTAQATMYVASFGGALFPTWGHHRDIYVDNT